MTPREREAAQLAAVVGLALLYVVLKLANVTVDPVYAPVILLLTGGYLALLNPKGAPVPDNTVVDAVVQDAVQQVAPGLSPEALAQVKAVVNEAVGPELERLHDLIATHDHPLPVPVRQLLNRMAATATPRPPDAPDAGVPAVVTPPAPNGGGAAATLIDQSGMPLVQATQDGGAA